VIGCQAATFGQIRHVRTKGKAGAQMERGGDTMQGQPGMALPEGEEPEELGPPEVPEEILDGWDKDEDIQAFLSIFASEELQGKKLLSHRDVAKLFESMGLSREQLSSMVKGEGGEDEDDEEEMSMLAQKGAGKGGDMYSYGGGKGGKGGYESDFDNFGGRGGKGGGKDGKGGGKGGGYEPDFGDFSGGGKGKGVVIKVAKAKARAATSMTILADLEEVVKVAREAAKAVRANFDTVSEGKVLPVLSCLFVSFVTCPHYLRPWDALLSSDGQLYHSDQDDGGSESLVAMW